MRMKTEKKPVLLVALGGNALIRKGQTGTRLIRWVEKKRNDELREMGLLDEDEFEKLKAKSLV